MALSRVIFLSKKVSRKQRLLILLLKSECNMEKTMLNAWKKVIPLQKAKETRQKRESDIMG